MKIVSFFLLCIFFLVLVLLVVISVSTIDALGPVPSFELNLDLPPQQRWSGAVATVVNAHGWDNSFGPVLDLYLPITWIVPPNDLKTLNNVLQTRFPENYGEMQGIYASLVKHGGIDKLASFEQFAAIAFAYEILHLNVLPQSVHKKLDPIRRKIAEFIRTKAREFSAKERRTAPDANNINDDDDTDDGNGGQPVFYKKACTGILSLPTNRSADIIHSRNMDEHPTPAKNLTLKITATSQGGRVAWEALDWLWFSSGVETSQRAGGVTMELNYRPHFTEDRRANYSFAEMVRRLADNSSVPVLLFHRVAHQRKMTYGSLLGFATQVATFAAPFYCIVSGTGRRGAVLTLHYDRSRIFVAEINDTYVYPESEGLSFALVQTNYDIANGQPDNSGDPRRTVAQNTLRMMGRERAGTELGVWMALSTYPVHNRGTFYTAMLSVSGKPIEGYLRRQMVPDPQSP